MIRNEKLTSLPTAYKEAIGVRLHPSTCHRHWRKGFHGIRLETVKCGGKRMTSVEAIHRFNEAVTLAANDEQRQLPSRTPLQRQRAIDRAEEDLSAQGI